MNRVAYVGAANAPLAWDRVQRYLGDCWPIIALPDGDWDTMVYSLLAAVRGEDLDTLVVHLVQGSRLWDAAQEACLRLVMEGAVSGVEFVPFVEEKRPIDTFAQAVPALRACLALSREGSVKV